MKKIMFLLTTVILIACQTNAQKSNSSTNVHYKINKTETEWKSELTEIQYEVLRKKGTERPHTGEYNLHFEEGSYTCAGCGTTLFTSNQKFFSDCGWPSFDNAIEGTVKYVEDKSLGMTRTEIVCASCGGHLGHVFKDGPTATGLRYCVNSASLDFEQQSKKKEQKKE